MKITLITSLNGTVMAVNFDNVKEITIGREIGNTIAPLTAEGMSRHHARLVVKEGKFVLEDLNSTNGTYRMGQKVDGSAELAVKDVIQMGKFEISIDSIVGDNGKVAPLPPVSPVAAPAPAPIEAVKPLEPTAPSPAPIEAVKPLEPVAPAPAPIKPLDRQPTIVTPPPHAPAAHLPLGAGLKLPPKKPTLGAGLKLPPKKPTLGAGLKLPSKPTLGAGLKLPPKKPTLGPGLKLPSKPAAAVSPLTPVTPLEPVTSLEPVSPLEPVAPLEPIN